LRVVKLYYTHCPLGRSVIKEGFHMGFKFKGDSVSHVIKLDNEGKARELRRRGVRAFYNGNSKCLIFETKRCLVKDLYSKFHVVSVRVHKDYIVAVVLLAGKGGKIPRSFEYGPCLIKAEEVACEESYLKPEEVELARSLMEEGLFDYPRRTNLSSLARKENKPKSTLVYAVRRIVRKTLNQVI